MNLEIMGQTYLHKALILENGKDLQLNSMVIYVIQSANYINHLSEQ